MASRTFPLPNNPRLQNIQRAPYELGYLLRQLREGDFAKGASMGDETSQVADAIWHHAGNAQGTLIAGLEALGNLMFVAGANGEYELPDNTLAGIGPLISHIAQELQFLTETERSMHDALNSKGGAK